jgi:hypothetical protein
MSSLTLNRERQSALFVLLLAVSVLAFAAWLKIAPSFSSDYRPAATQMTKLWVDPTQGSETLIKVASVGILFFFFAPLPSLALVRERSWQSGMAPRSAARDIFAESRHWFRPPPLF